MFSLGGSNTRLFIAFLFCFKSTSALTHQSKNSEEIFFDDHTICFEEIVEGFVALGSLTSRVPKRYFLINNNNNTKIDTYYLNEFKEKRMILYVDLLVIHI